MCQLQAVGTLGRYCLGWYPVCVPRLDNTDFVCHNLGTQFVQTTDHWHTGSSLIGLAPSVCAPI